MSIIILATISTTQEENK
ncbi:hypothetical protein ACLBOM_32075 [Escherichia coli]